MITLEEYCAYTQVSKKGGETKLFHDHDYFFDKIILYDLCMKFGYHREVIHNIFKN